MRCLGASGRGDPGRAQRLGHQARIDPRRGRPRSRARRARRAVLRYGGQLGGLDALGRCAPRDRCHQRRRHAVGRPVDDSVGRGSPGAAEDPRRHDAAHRGHGRASSGRRLPCRARLRCALWPATSRPRSWDRAARGRASPRPPSGPAACSTSARGPETAAAPASAARGRAGTFPIAAFRVGGRTTWGVEGVMLSAGTCIQWLRDGLGILASAEESEAVAAGCESSGDVWFVPALARSGHSGVGLRRPRHARRPDPRQRATPDRASRARRHRPPWRGPARGCRGRQRLPASNRSASTAGCRPTPCSSRRWPTPPGARLRSPRSWRPPHSGPGCWPGSPSAPSRSTDELAETFRPRRTVDPPPALRPLRRPRALVGGAGQGRGHDSGVLRDLLLTWFGSYLLEAA